MRLPLSIYSAAQVRELDRRAIENHGVPGAELMERAGAAVWEVVRERFPRARRIAVVCGPGNNGGDGYVIARRAKESGFDPVVLTLGMAAQDGDAAHMRARCTARIPAQPFDEGILPSADLIVDALLGTGLGRAVQEDFRRAVECMNAADRPIVAVDVPSGLNADTGAVLGAAVRARVTVTFIGLKAGLFTADGPDCAGEVIFNTLGVPSSVYDDMVPFARRLEAHMLAGLVRPRARNAHKGSFGHVLVVGGGRGMPGAVRLCGEAALRSGAGLVTLATHPLSAMGMNAGRPELLVFGVRSARELKPLYARASSIALGPGLAKDAWSKEVWRATLAAELPLVVDADALNLLAAKPVKKGRDWVLTPHPGEAARLLGTTTQRIQRDRFGAARAIVERFGGVCVLKGAGTLVVSATDLWLCDRGNPGMASGGTGDVLTGIIAALRGQGLSSLDAACLGVWLHAVAGDDAAAEGEVGLIASDLYPHIRRRLNRLVHDAPPR